MSPKGYPAKPAEAMTDEELAAIDEYYDPAFRPGRVNRTREEPVVLSDRREDCLRAAARDDFWTQAAAFGTASAGGVGGPEVTYMDAMRALNSHFPRDGRIGNSSRGENTGDTMRRKFGREV